MSALWLSISSRICEYILGVTDVWINQNSESLTIVWWLNSNALTEHFFSWSGQLEMEKEITKWNNDYWEKANSSYDW